MRTRLLFGLIFFLMLVLSGFAQTKEARLFYEFDLLQINCEEAKLWIDYFAHELHKNPESKGYIIHYGSKINTYNNQPPRRNESKERMEEFMEDYIVSTRLGGNVKLIDGGYRGNYTVQFWVVPKGAKSPIPAPVFKRDEIKFRSGKYKKNKQKDGC